MYDACVPWPERPKGAKDKSRGPKGLELEVGARRAPKLLVSYIILFIILVSFNVLLSLFAFNIFMTLLCMW